MAKEITDDDVKKKHDEFNEKIRTALAQKQGFGNAPMLSPLLQKLRSITGFRRPTLERPVR